MSRFLLLAATLCFLMMVAHVLTTILAYLAAFAIVGLLGWWLLKAPR